MDTIKQNRTLIEIIKEKEKLFLKYYSNYVPNWIEEKLHSDDIFTIKGVFHVNKENLNKGEETDFEDPEYYFKIGSLTQNYFQIDSSVFDLKNDFFFHKDIDISKKHFIVESKISLLKQIDKHVSEPVYIGGNKEGILPYETFERLIKTFPSSHEIKLYRQAKVTSILRDYFENVKDKESQYHSYINKKTPFYKSNLRKIFKDSEIKKYETLLVRLKKMLKSEDNFSEKQWQDEILQIILLLFPKYVAVFDEVTFRDDYNNKKRKLDFGLIDFMGNLDVVEIKIPFESSIVTKGQYRDNHIPKRDLSGTVMQIEKYIFYLNKIGVKGENKLTKKYKAELPEGLEIKITNPNGIIIMGRDNNLEKQQLADFEIIKRKYKNIIDIFTYDDLLRRLEITG